MDIHEIAQQIAGEVGGGGLHLRQGVVTVVAGDGTLSVKIGGSAASVSGIRSFASTQPAVDEAVWLAVDGPLVIAIGRVGDPLPIDPALLPTFETYFTDADTPGAPSPVAGLAGAAGFTQITLSWTLPPEALWRTWQVFEGTTSGFTPVTPILTTDQTVVSIAHVTGSGPWYYKVRAINSLGVASTDVQVGPFTLAAITAVDIGPGSVLATKLAANSVDLASAVVTGQVAAAKVADGAIQVAKLADGAVTAAKIAAAAVDMTKFASGIVPPRVVATLPTLPNAAYPVGSTIMLTTDGKLYKTETGLVSSWETVVNTADLTGTIAAGQIADGSVLATKLAANAVDLASAVVTGQVAAAKIAAGAVDSTKLAAAVNTAISAAQADADAAQSDADTAQTTANGKNKIIFSTSAASGTAYATGDLWFQKSGALIIAQWEFVAGAWAARTIDSAVIANLDAGKITAGTLAAARIAAATITADKIATGSVYAQHMVLANFDNLVPNGNSEQNLSGAPSGAYEANGVTSAVFFSGSRCREIVGTGASSYLPLAALIPVNPGEQYWMGAMMRQSAVQGGALGSRLSLDITNAAGATIALGLSDLQQSTTWTDVGYSYTIPAGGIGMALYMYSLSVPVGQSSYVDELYLRRMNDANLIVDGSITASELAAGAVTAGRIAAGTIVAADIAASTITVGKLAVDAVTAGAIAAGAITGAKIAAGTITAAQIAADTITAGQIAAGAIGADEIAAKSIFVNNLIVADYENLIPNSNSEVDPTGQDTSATSARVEFRGVNPYLVHNGTLSRRVQGNGTGSAQLLEVSPVIPVRVDDEFYFEAWTRCGTPEPGFGVRLYTEGVNAAGIGVIGTGTSVANATGTWTDLSINAVISAAFLAANPTVVGIRASLYFRGATTNWGYCDDMLFRKKMTGSLVVDGTITASELAANSVTATQLAANSVVAGKIAAGTIVAADIAASTITGAKIAAGTIVAGNIAAGAITATEIAAGAILTAKLAAGAVTTNELAALSVTAAKIVAGTITADRLTAGTITAAQIAAGTITAAKLNVADVQAGIVTAAVVNALTLNAINITGGTIKTATSGPRIQLGVSGTGYIDIYDNVGNLLQIYGSGGGISIDGGALAVLHGLTTTDISCADIRPTGMVRPQTNFSSSSSEDGIWIQDSATGVESNRWKLYFNSATGRLYVANASGWKSVLLA